MFLGSQNGDSNRQKETGQTLFQYLKRKKQIALKQSLSKNKSHNISQSHLDITTQGDLSRKANISVKEQSKKTKRVNSQKKKSRSKSRSGSNSTNKENQSRLSNIVINQNSNNFKTTRRSFETQKENQNFKAKLQFEMSLPKPTNRSFISMISPLKNKQISVSQKFIQVQKSQPCSKIKHQQKKMNVSQIYNKRNLKMTIEKIQKQFQIQEQFTLQLKQKVRQLCLCISSSLTYIEQLNSSGQTIMDRKVKSLRSNMKLVSSFVQNESKSEGIDELINSLYSALNQNLDAIQGEIKNKNVQQKNDRVYSIKHEYQAKMEDLNKEKNRLSRQITVGNKSYEKLQKEYNRLLERHNQLEVKFEQQRTRTSNQSNLIIEKLELQIQGYSQRILTLQDQNKNFSKKLKDCQYRNQQLIRQNSRQYESKINEREQFLLQQIEKLKIQFNRDISSLNNIHQSKEQQFINKIRNLQVQSRHFNLQLKQSREMFEDVNRRLKAAQDQCRQTQFKAQSAIQDLYRMNEQLYRHWLAIKDIKTLLNRLGLFDKFQTIYRDLAFDELLFTN